ncbi:MAG: acyltransferase [Alphaproteobacteria bacterium]|nr:MAG: acyltransferase [Alphaproteobacteria bacterium]
MNDALLNVLRSVDTPTVCNAIEAAQGKRGFNNFTKATMVASAPEEKSVVGYALTAKIAATSAPEEPAESVKERRMAYYKYMAEGQRPSVAVIEDCDFPNCVGAFWGEINTTVHKGFGVSGVVTNGVVRDLGDLPTGFPVIAGSIGPSHAFVHVREFGKPVSVFGLAVEEGDLVHADRHGALVIPSLVIPSLQHAIEKLIATERLVLDPASKPDFDFEAFAKAWAAFEAART